MGHILLPAAGRSFLMQSTPVAIVLHTHRSYSLLRFRCQHVLSGQRFLHLHQRRETAITHILVFWAQDLLRTHRSLVCNALHSTTDFIIHSRFMDNCPCFDLLTFASCLPTIGCGFGMWAITDGSWNVPHNRSANTCNTRQTAIFRL